MLNVKVTTASKHEQSILDVAAPITVISQEEIKRSGARNIPDLLRQVPGMQVEQSSSNRWDVSARGAESFYANKLLVLVDGRSVYTPIFSGVFWDDVDLLLEDIDRIEVIRGPGGSLWGANAVNGIINIITKKATETKGVFFSSGAGNFDRNIEEFRYGAAIGTSGAYRIYAKYHDYGPSLTANYGSNQDSGHSELAGFRVDLGQNKKDQFTFQGQANSSSTQMPEMPTPYSASRLVNDPTTSDYLLARWTHDQAAGSTTLQAYYDRSNRNDPELLARQNNFNISLQQEKALGAHHLVYGSEYNLYQDSTRASDVVAFIPDSNTLHTWSVFLQDEITVTRRDQLTLGTKLEHNDFTAFELQPSIRYLHRLDQNLSLWAGVSRAVRTPSLQDNNGSFYDFAGNTAGPPEFISISPRAIGSEHVTAYEMGFRSHPNTQTIFGITAFLNDYDHLRAVEMGTPILFTSPFTYYVIPEQYSNGGSGETVGIELSGKFELGKAFHLRPVYSYCAPRSRFTHGSSTDTLTSLDTTPRSIASCILTYDASSRCNLSAALYYQDKVSEPAFEHPPETRLDMSLRYHPNTNLEYLLSLQNLLAPATSEGVAYTLERDGYIPRSIYVGASYHF